MTDFGLEATIAGQAGPPTPNPSTGVGLVTPAMLAKLRSVGYKGLVTDCTVYRRQLEENPYGDGEEIWVNWGTYKGWLRMMNKPHLAGGIGQISQFSNYRLHLEAGVEVLVDDQIEVDGERYTVQDVNDDDTIRIFTTCILRRVQ